MDMKFPQDLFRFFYWIYFKPISLYTWIHQLDPMIGNVALLLRHSSDRSTQSLKSLTLFYVLIMPWLLGFGTGLLLSQQSMEVNWLKLAFYVAVGIVLSVSFSIPFCIAFLLPFSVAVALWSSTSFTPALGIFFSLMLGLAYGLNSDSARWGLTAGLVYAVFLSFVLGPVNGLAIGMAFLIGYFRIVFYVVEVPLSWILGTLAPRGDALKLWQFHPVRWDELIWFPLPRLDRHLLAIRRQNGAAAPAIILQVQESFRQRWAVERTQEQE